MSIDFPNPAFAGSDGLLHVGGRLTVENLLKAYDNGIFPWYEEGQPVLWYSPDPRCVIHPDRLKISKSMRPLLNGSKLRVTFNRQFDQVIRHCQKVPRKNQFGTWITKELLEAFNELHQMGHAKSVEVWEEGNLVGGLYGIQKGRVFCGESMFSLVPNASKLALIHLCKQNDYDLIDCQVPNEHLHSLGATDISRKQYLELLQTLK